jgi:hypothetical protein
MLFPSTSGVAKQSAMSKSMLDGAVLIELVDISTYLLATETNNNTAIGITSAIEGRSQIAKIFVD